MYFEETKLNDEKSFRSRFPVSKINIAITITSHASDWPVQGVTQTLVMDTGSAFRKNKSTVHSEQLNPSLQEKTVLCTTQHCPTGYFIFDTKLTLISQESEPPR